MFIAETVVVLSFADDGQVQLPIFQAFQGPLRGLHYYLLNAGVLAPIHYGFDKKGLYEEFPEVVPTLKKEAATQKVTINFLQAGESVEWN